MSYIAKPKVSWAGQERNSLGLTLADYEGGLSTLCAGCGHDSITAALVKAFWELALKPWDTAAGALLGGPDDQRLVGGEAREPEPGEREQGDQHRGRRQRLHGDVYVN